MQTIKTPTGILESESLPICVDALRKGEIICYPTETFYALGINLWNNEALEKLYKVKKRSEEKELPLIASDIPMVASVCDTGDSRFDALAGKFWPGPLTIVLRSIDGSRTFAIRVSSHPVAVQLAQAFGSPLVSTSANRSGDPPVHIPDLLPAEFKQIIAILIDSGRTSGRSPSTIVSLLERPGRVLREGAIPSSEIVSLL